MNDRADILDRFPLTDYLGDQGVKLFKSGANFITNVCPSVEHRLTHRCVTVNPDKQVWHCNDCDTGGSIIDWMMVSGGQTASQVIEGLGGQPRALNGHSNNVFKPAPASAKIVATYDYTDETGKLIFQVVRYAPKTFKQRQPAGDGGWTWGLEGITRVLFNLPKVLTETTIFFTEGEKDVLTLQSLGFTATTSAGGSKGWLSAYSDSLKGKDVILVPHNDEPGDEYASTVIESLSEKANSIKRIRVPKPHKDVSDYVASFSKQEKAKKELDALILASPHVVAPLPLYTIGEMETRYRGFVRQLATKSFDLSKFLPALGNITRHLVPGEVVLILSDTGVGKTAICQTICRAAAPLPTLLFELELPLELLFERFAQMESVCYGRDVEEDYKQNEDSYGWDSLKHIIVCPQSGLTTAQIESYILRSELKFGVKPVLVCVDYIGLVKNQARSRYEAMSDNAEQMKVIAKRTETIVVITSQIARPNDKKESLKIRLHDAKDSGALENSAGLILGCWRPEKDKLILKVLKNTKGASGAEVECNFDGAKMQITESIKGIGKSTQEEF